MIQLIIRKITQNGIIGFYENVLSVLEDYFFDFYYDTDTVVKVRIQALDFESKSKLHAYDCYSTRSRSFNKLIAHFDFPENSELVDFGSGKGKLLMLARNIGIKKVTGIELSKDLVNVSLKNIKSFSKKKNYSYKKDFLVINDDVLNYKIKDTQNIFFFFNPFDSNIMKKILNNIILSIKKTNRKVWIIYNNPIFDNLISSTDFFKEQLSFRYGSVFYIIYTN